MTPSIETHFGASASFLRVPAYDGLLARLRQARLRSGGERPKKRYPPRRTDYMEAAAMAREMYRL